MAICCLGLVPSCFTSENRASDEEMIEFFKDDLVFPFSAGADYGVHILLTKTYPTHLTKDASLIVLFTIHTVSTSLTNSAQRKTSFVLP